MRKIKFIVGTTIAILLVPLFSVPVFAVVAQPSAVTINSVNVFESCLETDDQLYIIYYTITYGTNPTEPANETYLARLMDGTTELGAGVCYAYYDGGYGDGIISIYFSAADVTSKSMTWEAATYSIQLEGNPALVWGGAGTPPKTIVSTFTNWYSPMGGYLVGTILSLATDLESAWTVNLIDTATMGTTFSAYGEDYFSNSIYQLSSLTPTLFSGSTTSVDAPGERTHPTTAAPDYTQWSGTAFDLTDTATALDISVTWLYGTLWFIVMIVVAFITTRVSNSYKPAIPMMIPTCWFGVYLGFFPWQAGAVISALLAIAAVFVLIYKPSYQ